MYFIENSNQQAGLIQGQQQLITNVQNGAKAVVQAGQQWMWANPNAPSSDGRVVMYQVPNGQQSDANNQGSDTGQNGITSNNVATAAWSSPFSGVVTQDGGAADGRSPLSAIKEASLESELQQLRSALSEKTKDAQRLMQELERANRIIEQLRQRQQQSTTSENSGDAAAVNTG